MNGPILLRQVLISLTIFICGATVYHYFIYKNIHEKPLDVSRYDVSDRNYDPSDLVDILKNISGNDFVKVAKDARPAVVYIKAYQKIDGPAFSNNYKREKGSGVIISNDGYIITNYHVVANSAYLEISLEDKREFLAEIVGTDPLSDLALLKIESDKLPFVSFGNSDSLQVGEWVLAIGNPFGLQSTVTCGIVSAKARSLESVDKNDIDSYIQTDAVINPGSSGGAMINVHGELVGISSAILSSTGNFEGISFAIPSNVASKIVQDILEFGSVQRGKLGISLTEVDAETATRLGLNEINGILITGILFEGAAANAGLKKGDVILAINGIKLKSRSDFFENLNRFRPGDKLDIKFFRSGETKNAKVVLTNHLNTTEILSARQDKLIRELGLEIRDLSANEKMRTKSNGVIVVSIANGSPIHRTNMEPGYIIEYINGRTVQNSQDLINQLKLSMDSVLLKGFYERYPGEFPYKFAFSEK